MQKPKKWDESLLEYNPLNGDTLTDKAWEEMLFRRAPNEFEYCRVHSKVLRSDPGQAHKKYRQRKELDKEIPLLKTLKPEEMP